MVIISRKEILLCCVCFIIFWKKGVSNSPNLKNNDSILVDTENQNYNKLAKQISHKRLLLSTAGYFRTSVLVFSYLALFSDEKEKVDFKWWRNISRTHFGNKKIFSSATKHLYTGMAYYLQGRQANRSKIESYAVSMVYSAIWEFGLEALYQRPSIQNILVTPIGGILIGETAFKILTKIKQNDYRLLNSKFLGKVTVFLLDPLHFSVESKLRKYKKKRNISLHLGPQSLGITYNF